MYTPFLYALYKVYIVHFQYEFDFSKLMLIFFFFIDILSTYLHKFHRISLDKILTSLNRNFFIIYNLNYETFKMAIDKSRPLKYSERVCGDKK